MRKRRKSCMLRPLVLLLLLFCTTFTASAELHKAGNSSFSTHEPSAFWLSQNAQCTFGFQNTTSNGYLLSAWFTKDPTQTPIWWPLLQNHSRKPVVSAGSVFWFTREGSLELWADDGRGNKTVVWSEAVSIGKGGFAEVRDTCNLVVLDMEQVVLWQSFSDPRNSIMLPSHGNGSVQDKALILDKPYLLQSKDSLHSYAPGRFHVSSDYMQNLFLYAALDQQYYQYNSGIPPKSEFIYMYASMDVVGNFQISENHGKAFISNGSMAAVNRLTLSELGNLKIYSWESNAWREIWRMIDDKCKLASPCGPFAICKEDMSGSINCTCPPSYNARLAMEASSKISIKGPVKEALIRDTQQGICGSNIGYTANCNTRDDMNSGNFSMVEVADSDYYYNDLMAFILNKNLEECKRLCLQDCRCMAASHSSTNKQCTLKGNMETGLLMNGYVANGTTLLVKMKDMVSLPHSTNISRRSSKKSAATIKWVVILCVSIGVVMLAATLACMWLFRKKRRACRRASSSADANSDIRGDQAGPRRFTYTELVEATNKFCVLLGEGGFGKVYKGWIAKTDGIIDDYGCKGTCALSDDQDAAADSKEQGEHHEGEKRIVIQEDDTRPQVAVAVKVLKGFGFDESDNEVAHQKHIDEGEKQFKAEVNTLGKIHHINLVKLLGYCATRARHARAGDQKRILVFEYMLNGSLDQYLTMPAILQEDYLPWPTRYSIALDIARGIAYLHHECDPPILHCDIKPQNVLLDENFSAKVADFGVACRLRQRQNHLTVTGLRGTRGYMAPEWLVSEEVTLKADVYSYGMLLLELIYAGELVDNVGGLIIDRSILLHWALQSISPGETTGFNVAKTPQADAPPCNLVARDDHSSISVPACTAGGSANGVAASCYQNRNTDDVSTRTMESSEIMSTDRPNEVHKDLDVDELTDIRVYNDGLEKLRLIKIGLWCVQFMPSMRPSMACVVQLLQGTIPVDDPPNPAPSTTIPRLPYFLSESTSSSCCVKYTTCS